MPPYKYQDILNFIFLKQMSNNDLDPQIKTHLRKTDFFLTRYKQFVEDVNDPDKYVDINDVELQCLGYGIFNKEALLANFYNYAKDMLSALRKNNNVILRSIKINLNGFKLNPTNPILQNLAQQIVLSKNHLKTLWFHTSNLEGCTFQDFQKLFSLCLDLNDINFENFSLQCADWRFEKAQPNIYELLKLFKEKIDSADLQKIHNKFWRLEISGWYYTEMDAKHFLGFKGSSNDDGGFQEFNEELFADKRQKFHSDMEIMLNSLLEGMDNINQLQLDMRNYHEILKMKKLKKKLDNVTKADRHEGSIMSKKSHVQAKDAEQDLKLSIIM